MSELIIMLIMVSVIGCYDTVLVLVTDETTRDLEQNTMDVECIRVRHALYFFLLSVFCSSCGIMLQCELQ